MLLKFSSVTSRVSYPKLIRSISSLYSLFPETLSKGPPPNGKFDIDIKELRKEYLKLQKSAHPDVSGTGGQQDSAKLSTAFKTLQNPVTRAEYILSLKGANPLEEGGGSLENEELLMSIMMAREQVNEAESIQELTKIIDSTDSTIALAERALADALENDDISTAQNKLIELTYWTKLKHAADERSSELQ